MSISCKTSEKEGKETILSKFMLNKIFDNFKLVVIYAFFPPLDLVKFYPSLTFPSFETNLNSLSSTEEYRYYIMSQS